MKNIENTYVNYKDLMDKVGKEVIQSRIAQLNQEMSAYIQENMIEKIAYINQVALTHAIMDYFTDVQRLKAFHHIEHINEIKIKAYETFWLLQRKPIQLREQLEDDHFLYVNEKFLLSRLASFMLRDNINVPLIGDKMTAFKNFLDTLYYYLKFRRCDAQSIEMVLLAFEAGMLI